ncbi:MAG: mechanosensitive ion channel [Pseudomonadota bacterium]|nr:mechanosensitive ion channel [Pseudomonadota bacterium]
MKQNHALYQVGFWVLWSLMLSVSGSVYASIISEAKTISSNDIEMLSQQLKQAEHLDEETQKAFTVQLEKSQGWVMESQNHHQQLQQLQNLIPKASTYLKELQEARKTLDNQLNDLENTRAELIKSEDLLAALNTEERKLKNANQSLKLWEKNLNQYLFLATQGANQQAQLEKTIDQLQKSQVSLNYTESTDLTDQIKNLLLNSRSQALKAELSLLSYKIDNLGILTELAQDERDLWKISKSSIVKTLEQLQAQLQQEKAQQASEDLQKSIEEQDDPNSPFYALQQKIIQVQKDKASLIELDKQIDHKILIANEVVTHLTTQFSRDKQIVELEGSNETIALVLHKRLESLSTLEVLPRKSLRVKNQINQAVLNQLLLMEKFRETEVFTTAEVVKPILEHISSIMTQKDRLKLEEQALALHDKYLQALKEQQNLYPSYIGKLSKLDLAYTQQQVTIKTYHRFLNNHLLWLPNVGVSGLFSIDAFHTSFQWFFSIENIQELFKDSVLALETYPQYIVIWLLLISALIYLRSHFLKGLKNTANQVISIRTDAFSYTIRALIYTLGLTIVWPLFLFGLALLFSQLPEPSDYSQALTKGLIDASILILVLNGLKQIARPDGLAERHFHWHPSVRSALQKELSWAIPLGAVLIILIALNTDPNSPAERQMIGRYGFILLMSGMAVLIYRLWSSKRLIMRDFQQQQKIRAWQQLHFIWFPLLLISPLALVWATYYGYYYTSMVIAERFNWTLGLILLVYLVRELMLRSLFLQDRKQRYNERVQKLKAANAETPEESDSASDEDPAMDYDKLSNQVRQALNLGYIVALLAGVWLLWQDIFPALNLINNETLTLTKSQLVDGVVQQIPLTLGDIILGVALGALTILFSKDLPGLLEFTFLKYLPISNAARYAITSLTQYIIAIIGFVMIFRALGIEWSNIQWLVAALSVGLGFGLQEIVANFVSGIILLFEQPIRVGDTVTVDDVTGKVSKIRIRATTIVNWDRQELVIPNKQIITGKFINWSLSDPVTRIKVNVGIAYGSDVNLALKLVKEAAEEHPAVLKEPESSVIFESFGDNALQLTLRAFVEDLENFILVKSELHSAINDKFNQAGIEISFPQRDVHLDTSSPLEINLNRPKRAE